MSVLVPESAQPLTYYFRVCDYQGDDGGSDAPYAIYANYRELTAAKSDLPNDALRDLPDTKYCSEAAEIDETSSIIIQQSSVQETEYKVNTSLLDFHGSAPPAWISINPDTPAVNPDPTAVGPFDITDGYEDFWVGDGWATHSPIFYVSVGDFDYIDTPPDDDWGYDVPYYFKLTLVYHSGVISALATSHRNKARGMSLGTEETASCPSCPCSQHLRPLRQPTVFPEALQ
jgi:hypothetical protein